MIRRVLESYAPDGADAFGQTLVSPFGLKKLLRDTDDEKIYFVSNSGTELVEVRHDDTAKKWVGTGKRKPYTPPASIKLHEGTSVTEDDIRRGRIEAVPGRTNGDVQLVMTVSGKTITAHVHAPTSARPYLGGVKVGHDLDDKSLTPVTLLTKILAHPDFTRVAKEAAPVSRADAGIW